MKFGEIIEAVKNGRCAKRAGWNGKNMMVFLQKGSHDFVEGEKRPEFISGIDSKLFMNGDVRTVTRFPSMRLQTSSGDTVVGWLASQTDMLAEDWELIDFN